MWLQEVCMQHSPARLYAGAGLKVETYRNGRAIPDGTLAPRGHFKGAGEWADAKGVLMTVEVTSYDRDTTQRDRVEKPRAYAESAIPVFLLIDRDSREVTVHSEPVGGVYQERHAVAFGKRVSLPEPVGIDLDTQELLALSTPGEN
jgi:Uma2 family endonuclease